MYLTVSSRPWMVPASLLALALLLSGCQTISYYSHAVVGQWRVLSGREPVQDVLQRLEQRRDQDAEAELLYARLKFSQQVLDFAESELELEVGKRYRTYVDLERSAVVWNLVASPELSLEPYRWCYPVAGCAPYRGFFDADYAERQARALELRGYETYVGRVAAYSTLGWFADPLLSSFVGWPEPDLAELLFHELSHSRVWVGGDVAFNESFATFVGRQGLIAWQDLQGQPALAAERRAGRRTRRRVLELLGQTREALATVYASNTSEASKRARKMAVLDAARQCYAQHREQLGGGYDRLMADLNNARLAAISTYEDLVPGFEALFDSVDGDWQAFYARVEALAELQPGPRRAALMPSAEEQVAQAGDDDGANQIQCEALAGHLLDAEAAG